MRHTVKRIFLSFKPYKYQIAFILFAIISINVLSLVVPLTIPFVFDDALIHHNMSHLFIYGSIMVGSTLLSGIIGVGQTYVNNRVGQHVMRDFRNKLYSHLQDMSLHFFTSLRTGEIQSRLSNDVSGAQTALTDTFTNAIASIVTALGTVVAMLYLSPLLTLVSFIFLPLFLFFTIRVGKMRRNSSQATQQSLASLNALMQETLSISGILLIKTFGRKQFAQSQFIVENEKLTQLSIHQQMVGRWFFMFVSNFAALMPVVLYIVAGSLIIYHLDIARITIGSLIAFISLQGRFFSSFSQLLTLQVNMQGSLALFDRIFEYLDLPIEIQDGPHTRHFSSNSVCGEVSFKNVFFTYKKGEFALPGFSKKASSHNVTVEQGEGAPVSISDTNTEQKSKQNMTLKNISFMIKPGQLMALVGPSGAGKTTITYLLSRLYDVDSGVVAIDGCNVKDIALSSLGSLIGVVSQETYLFHTSVRQNLLYVRPDATEEEMVAAAQAASIHDRIMGLDDGYETVVGERGYRLSGGEKQRLAIARVLLKEPRILILDEATSSLDTQSERLIQTALQPLMQGRTTIAIAHRLSTVLAADLILVMDKGEIVERGPHQELLERRGLYARLYEQQFAQQLSTEKAI